MIYSDGYKSKSKNENYKKPDYISLGCAIENMSLQAVNFGFGSCILYDTLYIENKMHFGAVKLQVTNYVLFLKSLYSNFYIFSIL